MEKAEIQKKVNELYERYSRQRYSSPELAAQVWEEIKSLCNINGITMEDLGLNIREPEAETATIHLNAVDIVESTLFENHPLLKTKQSGDYQQSDRYPFTEHTDIAQNFALREQFAQDFQELRNRCGSLDKLQFLIELQKIIAKLADGHTTLSLERRMDLYGTAPFILECFSGKYYVTYVKSSYINLGGAELISVGGKSVDELSTLLCDVVPRANEYTLLKSMENLMCRPILLMYFLDPSRLGNIEYRFKAKDGHEVTILIVGNDNNFLESVVNRPRKDSDVSFFPSRNRPYFFEVCDKNGRKAKPEGHDQSATLYLNLVKSRFPEITDIDFEELDKMTDEQRYQKDRENLGSFFSELQNTLDMLSNKKLIIDLRENPGGSSIFSDEFLRLLSQLNPRPKLVVLIGRSTLSAGISIASFLRRDFGAKLVGVNTSDTPNLSAHSTIIELPGLDVSFSCSRRKYRHESGNLDSLVPDIVLEQDIESYMKGEDVQLRKALEI